MFKFLLYLNNFRNMIFKFVNVDIFEYNRAFKKNTLQNRVLI